MKTKAQNIVELQKKLFMAKTEQKTYIYMAKVNKLTHSDTHEVYD